MAQEFSKAFYKSKQWKQCRQAYIASVYGLCERCNGVGYIVHHKTKLTHRNINNINITLNHRNLEYLCLDCHNKEHFAKYSSIADGLFFDSNGNLVGSPH